MLGGSIRRWGNRTQRVERPPAPQVRPCNFSVTNETNLIRTQVCCPQVTSVATSASESMHPGFSRHFHDARAESDASPDLPLATSHTNHCEMFSTSHLELAAGSGV